MSSAFAATRLGGLAMPATLGVILAAAATACNPVHVRTTEAPDAHLTTLSTFVIATPTAKKAGVAGTGADPMLNNSISNQALRQDLQADFQAKGYTIDSAPPSFEVAYYASAHQKLDVTDWDYGYRFGGYHRWWHGGFGYGGYPVQEVTEYTQGTVIVDVIDPATKELLWRGQGKAEVSDDPAAYTEELARTVSAIIAKFPAVRAVAAQGS